MRNILLAVMLFITPLCATAQETVVVKVDDRQYQWQIKVTDCNINPDEPVNILRKSSLPNEKIVVRQKGKTFRCQVKEIKVLVG